MESMCSASYVGNQLRKKREEKLLTLDDVASQLRLKKDLITDIENGDYHKIPTPYLKGYVRSYAKLLAISDTTDEFKQLDRINNSNLAKEWSYFVMRRQVSASNKFIQWITYCIISVLIIMVMLWWNSDNTSNKTLGFNDTISNSAVYDMAENNVTK